MTTYLYVSLQGEDRISIFTLDPAQGTLTKQHDITHPNGPAPLAVDPARRYLYVGCRTRGAFGLSSFRIEPQTGRLVPIGSIGVEGDPVYVATDRTGRFLLSAYYYQSRVAVHAIRDTGELQAPPVEWRQTAIGAHAIETDPSNQFVFVPHIAKGGALDGPNEIFQFAFDGERGRLAPNAPAAVSPGGEAGPRHICFHPHLDVVYSSNEQECSVTAYQFNRTQGVLTPVQTVSTLPADFVGRNTCSQIRITPSGRFLYAPNRGHNSIAGFAVDATTGRLTLLGQTPTEPIPRAFNFDPEGQFLYVAGLESCRLASYRIEDDNGRLTPVEVHDVGQGPMWVLALTL